MNEYLNEHIESLVKNHSNKNNIDSNTENKSMESIKLVKNPDGSWTAPYGVIVEEIPEQKPVVI